MFVKNIKSLNYPQNRRLSYIQPEMSRRTFGRHNKYNNIKTEVTSKYDDEPNKDGPKSSSDLGPLEGDQRLKSLIAKKRAKKMLSMQPIRNNNHIDYLRDYDSYNTPQDNQCTRNLDAIKMSKNVDDDCKNNRHENQPGSAPSVLLPNTNPFDIPYDKSEEKPNLSGGSFEEEIFANIIEELKEDSVYKHFPDFLSKPNSTDKPGFSRFRKGSDVEENMKKLAEELTSHGSNQTPYDQESTKQVRHIKVKKHHMDESTKQPYKDEPHQSSNKDIRNQNIKTTSIKVRSKKQRDSSESEYEKESYDIKDQLPSSNYNNNNGEKNLLSPTSSTSSSESCSYEIEYNATKDEAFTNSVRKVLICFSKNKDATSILSKEITNNIPTSMQLSTSSYHTRHNSLASDMQVELSDTGSPRSSTLETVSSPDRDSYDGDIDRDANNSGDEDPWGNSPHPFKFNDFGEKFKSLMLNTSSQNNASEPHELEQEVKRVMLNSPLFLKSKLSESNSNDTMDSSRISYTRSSSLVRDNGIEEITIQYEINNPVFDLEEEKEHGKEIEDHEELLHENGKQNLDTNQ